MTQYKLTSLQEKMVGNIVGWSHCFKNHTGIVVNHLSKAYTKPAPPFGYYHVVEIGTGEIYTVPEVMMHLIMTPGDLEALFNNKD